MMTVHQPVTDGVAIGTRVIRADGVFSNDTSPVARSAFICMSLSTRMDFSVGTRGKDSPEGAPAGIGRLTNQPGGERVIYKCVPGASWPVRSTYST
jgi:hypothetical protein